MLPVGIGIDIVSVPRVEKLISRFGERFLKKILPEGYEYCLNKTRKTLPECIAARFALKEATVKALHQAGFTIGIKDVSIKGGGRELHLHVKELPPQFKLLYSISHEREFAVAVVNVIKLQYLP